jgi:hypothetical protein
MHHLSFAGAKLLLFYETTKHFNKKILRKKIFLHFLEKSCSKVFVYQKKVVSLHAQK